MKKTLFFIVLGFLFSKSYSQEVNDALRYSSNQLNGSARFQALSGAFGALGGDITSINVNPAGSAIFLRNQFNFTLSNYGTKNTSSYNGSNYESCTSSFEFNQIGTVFVFNNPDFSSDWKRFTMAFDYENTFNYDNNVFSYGVNPTTSAANYFLSYANGVPLNVLEDYNYNQLNYQEQQAYLGYQGYIINPLINEPENTKYYSNVPPGGNYYHENYLGTSGRNGKFIFNLATQFKDRFYFGLNLNSNFVDYYQYTRFEESNNNSKNIGLKSMTFENNLYTYGYGFSLQLGVLAKITNSLRMGVTYESPTWYDLTDELVQNLSSTGYNYGNPPNKDLSSVFVDSNYIMVYQYELQTPTVWTASLAYVYFKKGLISFDYIYKDFGNAKYTNNNTNNSNVNQAISNTLDLSNQFRLGAEYRIKQLSLRGGYRFEGSPYKNKQTLGDLNGFSTGLGYSLGSTKIDFSYSYSHVVAQQQFLSQGFTDGAQVHFDNNYFSLTMLYDF